MIVQVLLLVAAVSGVIAVEAFFSGTEAAVISCDKVAVRHLARLRNRAAVRLRKMLKRPDRIVAATLLGTNLAVVGNSVILTVFATKYLGPATPALVTLVLGPLVFFFGELLPKTYFQQKANRLALLFSGPLAAIQVILSPVMFVLNAFGRRIIGEGGPDTGLSDTVLISRDQLASSSQEALASLKRLGPRAISRVIQFSEKRVGDAMVDISQVISVSPGMQASRAMSVALERGVSRLLVHSGQLNNLVGFVHISSLHAAFSGGTIQDCMSQLLYVAEAQRCSSVLKQMQRLRVQMAAVVNEYGACIGIVTLEDLIEEIFGEIRDEFDRPARIEHHADAGFVDVDASIGVSELRRSLDISLPSGRYETLAGFLLERFGAIPQPGTVISWAKKNFIITDSDKRRINRVRIVIEDGRRKEAKSDAVPRLRDNRR